MGDTVEHRSGTEAINTREVQLFMLELKRRGTNFTGKKAKITWVTLEFLVWKHLRIILSDLA